MSRLTQIQEALDSMVSELKLLGLPPLGPAFADLDPPMLHDALVVHRATKKYEVPDARAASLRKDLSIKEVIERDSMSARVFNYRDLPTRVRGDYLLAQQWLREFFKDFKHLYGLRFPTGESFVSAGGLTDLYYKLSQESQWLISPELVDYAVNIIVRNRALANVVRRRFREKYGLASRKLMNALYRHLKREGAQGAHLRFLCYRFMFRRCVTFNRTSRITTVPKDNNRDRVITCESLWTMICQLSYASSLKSHMLKRLGIDLDSRQGVHRALVRVAEKATIDLKTASDLNLMCVLRDLWPKSQVKWLERMRTGIFELPDGTFHPLSMFAPMGCGCTFEIMTLTLLAHTRVLDRGSSVFGDDIIIEGSVAARLCDNLEAMGWRVNTDKSFITGPFRESCGAFADVRTQELLLSYDFERPATMSDAYILAHKIARLGQALYRSSPVRKIFVRYYATLLMIVARDAWVPFIGRSYTAVDSLSATNFHVPAELMCERRGKRSTWWDPGDPANNGRVRDAATQIAHYWQTPVLIQSVRKVVRKLGKKPKHVDPYFYAAYMRRGEYAPPLKGEETYTVQMIVGAGVAVNTVPLVSVL